MKTFLLILILTVQGFAATDPAREVENVLNQLHESATKADGKLYFTLFSSDAVFMGTDLTERWTLEEFKKYALPRFAEGKGWSYIVKKRNVTLAPLKDVAWFDEVLENKNYGLCRGTGVLVKSMGHWKISQYNLTIPIPNGVADSVVKLIQKGN